MGFTRERAGAGGKVRYAAMYRDLKGRQRSAGTFAAGVKADRAWQRAEAKVAQGYLGEPGRGRQSFRDYVEKPGCRTTRSRRAPASPTPTC